MAIISRCKAIPCHACLNIVIWCYFPISRKWSKHCDRLVESCTGKAHQSVSWAENRQLHTVFGDACFSHMFCLLCCTARTSLTSHPSRSWIKSYVSLVDVCCCGHVPLVLQFCSSWGGIRLLLKSSAFGLFGRLSSGPCLSVYSDPT